MKNFTYYRPTTVEQAVGLLDSKWGPTELLAGGTDLLDLQKEYVAQPDKVISLGGLADLNKITRQDDGSVIIGAGAKLSDIAENDNLQAVSRALTTAAGMIGGPQIRNMGTLGGNLCQRNRCWYFRDEHVHCLLKGGKKCFATDGENQYHAVFTQGHRCVIVGPSTLARR
jgi:xanthine dehydrogenase YagS FAD-binding subunit